MSRVYNFSAGPAVLPLEVLQDAQKELVDYKGCGMSVMEMSHRGKDYDAIHQEAVATFKELCGLGDDWAVCFVQGGASMQFAMIPMNFLGKDQSADYANQGTWSNKALKQAQMIGAVNVVANCQKDIPTRMPADDEFKWTPGAAYSHVCTNETISGAELKVIPNSGSPLIGDMSSDILSCERDYSKFAMFYAGAQKNLGPSGMAVVAIRKELAEKGSTTIPTMLQYRTYVDENSLGHLHLRRDDEVGQEDGQGEPLQAQRREGEEDLRRHRRLGLLPRHGAEGVSLEHERDVAPAHRGA